MAQLLGNFNKAYRRGLVLGLSLAEVFLILLFLILLVSIGLTSSLQEELNETEQKLNDSLNIQQEVIGREITIEEFIRLEKKAKELARENEALSDQLADAQKKLAKADEVLQTKVNELESKINELDKELIKEQIKNILAESRLENTKKEIWKKDRVIEEYAKKGQDPPCWFVNVPDVDEVDGIRQKHVKIFDVKIEDNAFSVKWHEN